MKPLSALLIVSMLLGFQSCKKEENKIDEGALTYTCSPDEYCFLNSANESTVNFSGQETRLNQLSEINTYLKSYITESAQLSAAQLKDMFSNGNGLGSEHFSTLANAAGKQLKNKCFLPNVDQYESWFDELEAMTQSPAQVGSDGTAGLVSSLDNSRTYLLDAQGFELAQLIQKGLMGDVFYYQAMEEYLSSAESGNNDNTAAVDPASGKYYTEAEHKFDEAFGYFGLPTNFRGSEEGTMFYGKYATERDPALEISLETFNAFIAARKAISSNEQENANAEIEIIRENWSKIIYGSIIHYLKYASTQMDDPAIKCHVLSEAIGFSGNLLFNRAPYQISLAELNEFKAILGDNLYQCSTEQINNAATYLFNKSGLSTTELAAL